MDNHVTIQIPQTTYHKAERLAHRRRCSLNSILDEAIELAEAAFAQQSREEQQMEREEFAYNSMYDELLTSHLDEYVAIYHGRLIDSDRSERELLLRLNRDYPDEVVMMRKVVAEPEDDLFFRSPRFVPAYDSHL
ncbi:MAG: hypothetical protein U0175_28645 [Caldilineaceae bacterium]